MLLLLVSGSRVLVTFSIPRSLVFFSSHGSDRFTGEDKDDSRCHTIRRDGTNPYGEDLRNSQIELHQVMGPKRVDWHASWWAWFSGGFRISFVFNANMSIAFKLIPLFGSVVTLDACFFYSSPKKHIFRIQKKKTAQPSPKCRSVVSSMICGAPTAEAVF